MSWELIGIFIAIQHQYIPGRVAGQGDVLEQSHYIPGVCPLRCIIQAGRDRVVNGLAKCYTLKEFLQS
jgi:hypothetical protein